MSDANLSTLASVRETTPGTTPNDGLKLIRFTKESLGFNKETVMSAEVRADRQVADSVKVHGQPSGSIDFECSFGQLLPILELALMGEWNTGNVSASINFSGAAMTATSGTFSDVPVGAVVKVAGSTDNDGKYRVVAKAANGSSLTVGNGVTFVSGSEVADVSWKTMTNGTVLKSETIEKKVADGCYSVFRGMAADTVDLTIESKKIVTGSVNLLGMSHELDDESIDPQVIASIQAEGQFTFSSNPSAGNWVEIGGRQYNFVTGTADAANEILIGATLGDTLDSLVAAINGTDETGIGPNTVAHAAVTAVKVSSVVNIGAIVPGVQGNEITLTKSGSAITAGGATLTGGVDAATGYIPNGTDPIVNGTNNFGTLSINSTVSAERMKSVKLKISNNLRGKDACGTEGNFDIGLGRFEVTGSINAYFRNSELQTKSVNHESISLEFYLENGDQDRIYFYLPNLKLTGDPTIEGVNTDVMIDTGFEAVVGTNATGRTLIIDHQQA